MKKTLRILTILILFWDVAFTQITSHEMVSKMGRGINLGNILSAPKEGNWAPALTKSYLEDVKSVGFKTVRIPIDFFGDRTSGDTSIYSKETNTESNYTGKPEDYIINSNYLNRVEEVIQWSLNEGLITILDFHGATLKTEFLYTFSPKTKWANYYTNPTSAKRKADNEKFRAIWTQIADRFKQYSENLIFEVVNEPYFWLDANDMDTLNSDIINIIRNTGSKNTTRNIIISGGGENSYESPLQINDTILAIDNYLIPTFHYYLPRDFTASSAQEHNTFTWGSNTEKQSVDAHFNLVKNWATSKNVPVFLGEFGADNENGINYSSNTLGSFGGPTKESRVAFHKYLAEKAIQLGFSFTVWDAGDKSNKTIYKVSDRSWVTEVRNALLGLNCLEYPLLKNADIECGYTDVWNLFVQSPAAATIAEASESNSRNNSKTLQINVTEDGGTFNKTILRNEPVTASTFSNKKIFFYTYAKGSNSTLKFKIRIKAIVNGVTEFSSSPALSLSSNYQLYEHEYVVKENTTSLEFQVLCGKTSGSYFFDDFSMQEQTLSIENNKPTKVNLYPNPTSKNLYISSSKKIQSAYLFSINGKSFKLNFTNNKTNVSMFNAGIYLIKIRFTDGSINTSKLLITK